MYERSEGAGRSRRGSGGSIDAAPEGGLAHADNAGDAMPGGIALTLESAKVSCGDGERAVIEELADRFDRLTDVAAELGGGVA